MSRLLKVLFSIVIMLTVFQSNSVEAASKYADGEYSVPFTVVKNNSNEKSVTNDYLTSPAKLVVKDGKNLIQITIKNKSWWQYFQVQNGGSFGNVTVLSEGKDTQLVQFEVQDVDKLVNAKVHIIVPEINYDNKYDVRFNFNTSNVAAKAAGPNKGTTAKTTTTEKSTKSTETK
ncbi:NEAT domain-containing protein, partial [Microvirga sp. 3-52]|nr:NEAT domain-containing protein [Microvirga sp. 3-52]